MTSLDSAILGVVPLPGVDGRCVAHAATAQVFHRATPIAGARLFVTSKGREAAVGFAIDETALPPEALQDALLGDLGARLKVDARHGVTTVQAAHLERHEGCGTFWDASAPQRKLSPVMARWRSPIVLAAIGLQRRLPVAHGRRPEGVGVVRLELAGKVDRRQVDRLIAAIDASADRTIVLAIDSPGGNAWEGRRLYGALSRHACRVEVDIAERAHSAASLIAMAGDVRRIGIRASMLVHEAFLKGENVNASNGTRVLRLLTARVDDYAAVYALRTGRPVATTRDWMRRETRFSAVDAVRVGLAHAIVLPSGARLFSRADLVQKSSPRPPARPAR